MAKHTGSNARLFIAGADIDAGRPVYVGDVDGVSVYLGEQPGEMHIRGDMLHCACGRWYRLGQYGLNGSAGCSICLGVDVPTRIKSFRRTGDPLRDMNVEDLAAAGMRGGAQGRAWREAMDLGRVIATGIDR